MRFQDSFEFEVNGKTFNVEVEGDAIFEEDRQINEINVITISDEMGALIDEDHECFSEVKEEALCRDYEVEEHHTNNSYYDEDSELEKLSDFHYVA